jgi:hypothetical protein
MSSFDEMVTAAARRADEAVNRAMKKYRQGNVTDEDDITGVLLGNLDAALDGEIEGLVWSTSVVRHRRGIAAEEQLIGADMIMHVSVRTKERFYSKGVLIQAKRVEPDVAMTKKGHDDLKAQCKKMLDITPEAFVFDYTKQKLRVGSALRVAGSEDRQVYNDLPMTSYRFFRGLFQCSHGDSRLQNAAVADLAVPNIIAMTAVQAGLKK